MKINDILTEAPQPEKFKVEFMRNISAVISKKLIDTATDVTAEGGKGDKRIVGENMEQILNYVLDDLSRMGFDLDVKVGKEYDD